MRTLQLRRYRWKLHSLLSPPHARANRVPHNYRWNDYEVWPRADRA